MVGGPHHSSILAIGCDPDCSRVLIGVGTPDGPETTLTPSPATEVSVSLNLWAKLSVERTVTSVSGVPFVLGVPRAKTAAAKPAPPGRYRVWSTSRTGTGPSGLNLLDLPDMSRSNRMSPTMTIFMSFSLAWCLRFWLGALFHQMRGISHGLR